MHHQMLYLRVLVVYKDTEDDEFDQFDMTVSFVLHDCVRWYLTVVVGTNMFTV